MKPASSGTNHDACQGRAASISGGASFRNRMALVRLRTRFQKVHVGGISRWVE